MIRINLITSKNDLIAPILRNEGFIADELHLNNQINSITHNSLTLLEIPNLNKDTDERITEIIRSLNENSRIVCFCETISQDIKRFLLKNGLADCIEGFDPARISEYLKALTSLDNVNAGRFLILEDRSTHKKILTSIINRFGYTIKFISTIDELFEDIKIPGNIMLLINMGTEKLDMNAVVRKSYNDPDIKKIPVIAYKSAEQGLFVHEIINGLNRLTKVIMSPEEIFCMLTDMLFKKEIMSFTNYYTGLLKYAKFFSYAEKSPQQIYYEIQSDPCGQDSLFDRDRMISMIQSTEKMRRSLIKIDGIIWLANLMTSGNQPTCGGGV